MPESGNQLLGSFSFIMSPSNNAEIIPLHRLRTSLNAKYPIENAMIPSSGNAKTLTETTHHPFVSQNLHAVGQERKAGSSKLPPRLWFPLAPANLSCPASGSIFPLTISGNS